MSIRSQFQKIFDLIVSLVLIALETKLRYIFKSTVAAAFVFKYNMWFDRICGLYWNYQEILFGILIILIILVNK